MTETIDGFKITDGKGFHMTFKNGVTVSVQFGVGNYCSNHNELTLLGKEKEYSSWSSHTAEVGIWDKNNKWITKKCPYLDVAEYDDVAGHILADEIIDVLTWAKNYKEA